MATGTITGIAICAGGEHVTVRLTVGAQNHEFVLDLEELRSPITQEEMRKATSVMARFHCGGLTRNQARQALQSGITVTTAA